MLARAVREYVLWLALLSILCFVAERIRPWRAQKALRKGFFEDLFWLAWNGEFVGLGVLWAGTRLASLAARTGLLEGLPDPDSFRLLAGAPLFLQFLGVLVFKDFVEWWIHNLLHRVPWLWEFHKLHHSIEELDWIGNFRFHWMEVVVYKSLTWLPVAVLGADGRALFAVAIFGTLIGHLNHSNLAIGWGPLRYVLNSPRMHVWHHDRIPRGGHGRNFGIVLSLWDWIFGTAYWPRSGGPERLGFEGMESFPAGIPRRLAYPLTRRGIAK
jgi:sterol desaturase/sphingolipid hydroxylase (fatty acid hydroxylase superfamily)